MRPAVRHLIPFLLAVGAVGGAAVAREQDRRQDRAEADRRAVDKALAGLTPGRASSCLAPGVARSASSRIYGSTIIYTVSSGLKYRNDTSVPCGSPGRRPDEDILVTSTPIGQSCSGDPAQVVDRYTGALRGVCSLGPFIPYRRP